MKKARSSLLIVIITTIIFISHGCAGDPTSLLKDGIWTFEDMTTDSENEDIQSLVTFGKAFMTDATLELQEGGLYIISSPLAEEPTTGEWELVGEDQLILDPDGAISSSVGNIDVLTKKMLKYIETFSDENSGTYTTTTTWVR